MHPTIKVVDGVSEGDVGLELHVMNQRMGNQEEITDDDVFKELINIVMDVFSNKSEKCMLTFELPLECGVLKEILPEELNTENGSASSNDSKSNILIPLKGSKFSKKSLNRRKRVMKIPLAKNSKYKLRKKFKKRLNPIVQTALHPKPGFTDLDRLFRMCPKQSHSTEKESSGRFERVAGSLRNTSDRWRDSAERDDLLNEVANLRDKTTHAPKGNTRVDPFENLLSDFKDVLEILEGLARSRERVSTSISFGELSHHLEGIRDHVEAIRNSLQDSQSVGSIDTIPQVTSTGSSEAPKRKNKVGVRLIRIGAKISSKSSMHAALNSKRQPKSKNDKHKSKSTQDAGLDGILKNYHRVKKEETKIVQVLLGKLGFRKDCSNHECRKRRLQRTECVCERKDKETADACDLAAEKIRFRDAEQNGDVQDMNESANPDVLKEPENNTMSNSKPKHSEQMSFLHDARGKQTDGGKHKRKPRKNRKRREPKEKSGDTSKRHSPIILHAYPPVVFSGRCGEGSGHPRKKRTTNARDLTEIPSGVSSKEDRMMHRVQSAAKRLEHMHSLVEKKLRRLCKQQKEMNRKMSAKNLGDDSPRESRSNDDSQNDVCEPPRGSFLNLSSDIEDLIFRAYDNAQLGESQNSKEILYCQSNDPQGVKEESQEKKLVGNSLHGPESRGKSNKEQFLCGSSQNYICNYMMELGGKEFELATKENQCGRPGCSREMVLSSIVLTNEFQGGSSSHGKDRPTTSRLSITTKENECEIIEESLFANANKNAQKPAARKKKTRVIHAHLCALS